MENPDQNLKGRKKSKPELSLMAEFLDDDNHFQGGRYDKPIHMRIEDQIEPRIALSTGSKVVANSEVDILDLVKTNSKVVAEVKTPEVTSSKAIANEQQSDSKVVANQEPTGSKNIGQEHKTYSKVVAEPVAEVAANQQQSSSKLVALVSFANLSGIQRIITVFLYEECKRLRSKITEEISITDLSSLTSTDVGTAKNAINRLIQKNVTRRYKYKDGRGGWTSYEVAENIYQEIRDKEINGKLIANWHQSGSKLLAEPVAKPVATSPSSSSSSNINKTTTTNDSSFDRYSQLPEEWISINLLGSETIPFYQADLLKVVNSYKPESNLPELAEVAQESIEAMINDVKSGYAKKHKSARAVLFRNLLDGTPYGSLDPNFVPTWLREKRRSLEVLRRYQKENEQIENEKAELRDASDSHNQEEVFLKWQKTKTDQEIKVICGNFNPTSNAGRGMLKHAFDKERQLISHCYEDGLGRR